MQRLTNGEREKHQCFNTLKRVVLPWPEVSFYCIHSDLCIASSILWYLCQDCYCVGICLWPPLSRSRSYSSEEKAREKALSSFPQHTMALMISSRQKQRWLLPFSNYFLRSLQSPKLSINVSNIDAQRVMKSLRYILYCCYTEMKEASFLLDAALISTFQDGPQPKGPFFLQASVVIVAKCPFFYCLLKSHSLVG